MCRWIGPDGERRTTYTAAVTEGNKRKVEIVMGDSSHWKAETRLNNNEDVGNNSACGGEER